MKGSKILKCFPKALVAQPFEVMISLLLIISGTSFIVEFDQTGPIPPYILIFKVIAGFAVAGSIMMVWGLTHAARTKMFSSIIWGHKLERLGLILQGLSTAAFATLELVGHAPGSLVGAATLCLVTIACGIRGVVLTGIIGVLNASRESTSGATDGTD